MTRPTQSLIWMAIFVAIVGLACVAIAPALSRAFAANAGFNGFIVCVFVVGLVINVRQVVMLYREIHWVDEGPAAACRAASSKPHALLAPMALMLSGTQ